MYSYNQKPATRPDTDSQEAIQRLREAEYAVLVGRNNCGKSFLLKTHTQQWGGVPATWALHGTRISTCLDTSVQIKARETSDGTIGSTSGRTNTRILTTLPLASCKQSPSLVTYSGRRLSKFSICCW